MDSSAIQRLYYRAMHLTDADSVKYYADYIDTLHPGSANSGRQIMVLRMYGWYYENKGEFTKALNNYYRALDSARKHDYFERQTELLADLAAVYTSDMKQPQKAKAIYQECVRISQKLGDPHSLIQAYCNL